MATWVEATKMKFTKRVEVVEKWSGWSGQYGIPGRPMKK